jgi:hypothetical protein
LSPHGYSVNMVAHSMGNIVAGSALAKSAVVDRYAMLNAAVPASCYDEEESLQQLPELGSLGRIYWDTKTPDSDSDPVTRFLAYRGHLKSIGGRPINFFLPEDSATTFAWEFNNDAFKPTAGFGYSPDADYGSKLWKMEPLVQRPLTDPEEAMPYADQSSTKAAGAEQRTGGAITRQVNLRGQQFSLPGDAEGFKTEHSAEFERPIQALGAFYSTLLTELRLSQNPE